MLKKKKRLLNWSGVAVIICGLFLTASALDAPDASRRAESATPTPTPSPSPAAADQTETPFAKIKNIVVNEVDRTEGVALEDVKVVRAKTGEDGTQIVEAGRPGMDLFANDVIITGLVAKVTITYLNDPAETNESAAEEYAEVIIDVGTEVKIANPRRRKLRVFTGSVFASVRGAFDIKYETAQAGVERTEYQIRVVDPLRKTTELLVLEGAVKLEKGNFSEPASGNRPAGEPQNLWKFEVLRGQVVDPQSEIVVENRCTQPHSYEIRSPANLRWITFPKAEKVTVAPGEIARPKIKALIDTESAGFLIDQFIHLFLHLGEKSYADNITIKCLDCNLEPACSQDEEQWRVEVSVTSAESLSVKELEKVTVKKDEPLKEDEKRPAERSDVEASLDLSNKVIIATQLKKLALALPQSLPSFTCTRANCIQERIEAFEKARFDAIWNKSALGYKTVGDVYLDVGEGAKALKAYDKAAEKTPVFKDSPEYLVGTAEAYRQLNQPDKATRQLEKALPIFSRPEVNDGTGAYKRLRGRFFVTFGNVELDKARIYRGSAQEDDFISALNKAQGYYTTAESILDDSKSRAVVFKNKATVLTTRAGAQLESENLKGAETYYKEAQKELNKAKELDPDNSYIDSDMGDVNRGLGNVEKVKGDKNNKADQFYKEAGKKYDEALRNDSDNVKARQGRGNLNAMRGAQAESQRDYEMAAEKSIKASLPDIKVPDVRGKLKAVAVEIMTDAGLLPVILNPRRETQASKINLQEYVVKQSIQPGTSVKKGTKVILEVVAH